MNFQPSDESRNLGKARQASSTISDLWEQALDACFAAASGMAAFCLLDEQWRCIRANAAFAALSRRSLDEQAGKTLKTLLPQLFPVLEPICQQVRATRTAVSEIELATNATDTSADVRYWSVSCFPIAKVQPHAVGLLLLETTRTKQLERALHLSESRFKALVQTSNDIITLETLRQQFEREKLTNKIAMRVLQTFDLQDTLNTAVAQIRHFLQADRVVITHRHSNGRHQVFAESVADEYPSCLQTTIEKFWLEDYLLLSHEKSSTVTDNLPSLSLPSEAIAWAEQLQIQSRVAMPIALGEQIWGVLAVHQCSTVRHWEPFEVELLEKLATQLAIAIQQSELHQQIQRLNDELESQVEARTAELQLAFEFEATLKRITDRVRDSLDEDQILQAAVRELVLVLKISGCNASLYDLEQGTSTTCYEYTTSISPYLGRVSKFSAVPELYSQLLQGQYFQFCSLVPNPERGVVAMLACPILDDQGVIGDLWLIHHRHYAFNEQDIRLVQQVANQCAIALRQAKLYEKSQAQVKELERLNQLKDDFLSTVSHELRTPLANIKMAIHMLKSAPTSEKRDRYMAILESECSRETELINDLLDLQKLENASYAVVLEPIDLLHWLPEVIAPFSSRAHNRQQRLQIELPTKIPVLMSDRRSLERILAELLNNACKYTFPEGTIRLSVLHQSAANQDEMPVTSFLVSNQANVPLAELPRMFEKFYRIPKSDPWQQGGTGLGLALVKKLVETLQGEIDASSDQGWTTFRVDLPMPLASDH